MTVYLKKSLQISTQDLFFDRFTDYRSLTHYKQQIRTQPSQIKSL